MMTAYLLFSIYDYTPNSAIFEVPTCYPKVDDDDVVASIDYCDEDKKGGAAGASTSAIFTDQTGYYSKSYTPSLFGVPFVNNYGDKTVSLALFFTGFEGKAMINYVNYYP